MPDKNAANWTANPEDITNLLQFFHEQHSRVGEGGNWEKTVLNEAAVHMGKLGPPAKGGPKTSNSISSKWKEKVYPGASGWDEFGFNVTDENRDVWNNFSKAHVYFKPFATCRWAHFKTVDKIMPSRALGRYVFSAGASQLADPTVPLQSQSQDKDNLSQPSQPLTDSWSQSNYGESQSPTPNLGHTSASQPVASQGALLPFVPPTPASTMKRVHSPDEVESPWSNKRSRATGPESILALGRSVDGIGRVIETVFAPKTLSAMSPTKKVHTARNMALADMEAGFLTWDERTWLHILFGRAADAYILDEDVMLHVGVACKLLNPTQIHSYN
ncbi:hypothetical protein B0H19DRAFT_1243314 [Mycena capillaripes]|nr:hypothetical protein B0H19DRAFT_1243314 [Mycena capillaripes]